MSRRLLSGCGAKYQRHWPSSNPTQEQIHLIIPLALDTGLPRLPDGRTQANCARPDKPADLQQCPCLVAKRISLAAAQCRARCFETITAVVVLPPPPLIQWR